MHVDLNNDEQKMSRFMKIHVKLRIVKYSQYLKSNDWYKKKLKWFLLHYNCPILDWKWLYNSIYINKKYLKISTFSILWYSCFMNRNFVFQFLKLNFNYSYILKKKLTSNCRMPDCQDIEFVNKLQLFSCYTI